jgi:hypothetical protein
MNKFLITILATMAICPGLVLAAPAVKLSSVIDKDCRDASQYACYDTATDTIYLSTDTKAEDLPYIFLHEYGHALTWNVPKYQLVDLFGEEAAASHQDLYEQAADSFYWYIKLNSLDQIIYPRQVDFFNNELAK